jgi:hypothetical protein
MGGCLDVPAPPLNTIIGATRITRNFTRTGFAGMDLFDLVEMALVQIA